jgi:hypothetical protein
MSTPLVLDPGAVSSPQLIRTAASLLNPEDFYPKEPVNNWVVALNQLKDDLTKLQAQAKLERAMTSFPFDLTTGILDFSSTSLPAPASYVMWFTQKKIELMKDFTLSQFDKNLKLRINRLANAAISGLMDSRNLPYNALFPLGDPNTAQSNLTEALQLMDDSLPPEVKSVVSKAIAKAALKILETNNFDPQDQLSAEEKNKVARESAEGVKAAEKMVEDTAREAEALAKLSDEINKQLAQNSDTVTRQSSDQLRQYANLALQANQISGQVLAAAVNLGLSEETASDIQKMMNLAGGIAQIYLGGMSNPMMSISGAASVVNTLFGDSKDPSAARHTQIMKTLSVIVRQNQQIIENQQKIYQGIQQITRNQFTITQLLAKQWNTLKTNRALLISIIEGPILLLEQHIEAKPEIFGSLAELPKGNSYETLKNDVFSDFVGVVLNKALYQLSLIFASDGTHPLLIADTYNNVSTFQTTVGNGLISLQVEQNEYEAIRQKYLKRLTKLSEVSNHRRMLTEYATFDLMFLPNDLLTDLAYKRDNTDSLGPLIETGTLFRFIKIVLQCHYFFQYTTPISGALRLKTPEELLNDPTPSDSGYLLLENCLVQLNKAISQQLLLSDRFFLVEFIDNWKKDADMAPMDYAKYKSIDRNGELLSLIVCSLIQAQLTHPGDLNDSYEFQKYIQEVEGYENFKKSMIEQYGTWALDYPSSETKAEINRWKGSIWDARTAFENMVQELLQKAGITRKFELSYDLYEPSIDEATGEYEFYLYSFEGFIPAEFDDFIPVSRVGELPENSSDQLKEYWAYAEKYDFEGDSTNYAGEIGIQLRIKINTKGKPVKASGLTYEDLLPLYSNGFRNETAERYINELERRNGKAVDRSIPVTGIWYDPKKGVYDDSVKLLLGLKELITSELIAYKLKENPDASLKQMWTKIIFSEFTD